MTGGIESTDLVFIAARPSMGKTELALDIIEKVSAQGHGVLFFSMEMSDTQITKRMVSAAGGMSMSRLKAVDKFEDEDWARFFNGMERMATRNIWITDATGADYRPDPANRNTLPDSASGNRAGGHRLSGAYQNSECCAVRSGRWRSIQGA